LIPKLLGATVILDLHDLMPEFYAGRFGEKSFGVRLVRWQERWSCRFADHVITVSEHWRQSLIKRGVSPAKCSVVMNVADDAIFHPLNGGGANRKAHQGFRLIYHGSMHQRYGLDLAVQAVHRLREEIPDIHLMLVGAGPFLTTLRSMVDELGIQANVSIEPLHLAEELPEIISSCDLGLVPYRSDVFTDGLVPTKLLEYAAMELPAVAARTTAIQAYFEDTNTEFFEPDDLDDLVQCILKLYKDPQRLCDLAQGSQKFNSRYSWAAISAEYTRTVRALGNV
jgi:glycosyltransferase involved in cell wall biosynthesis